MDKFSFKYVNKEDDFMVDTPLAVNRSTGVIYINPKLYSPLTAFQKKFWMWHEKGHYFLDTDDEIKADNYAFDHMAGKEFRSLKQMIEAAEDLLDENNPYHKERIDNLYNRAIEWDKTHPIINKVTSKQQTKQIETLTSSFEKQIQTLANAMIGQTQATSSATQGASNSATVGTTLSTGTIVFLAIMALLILRRR